MYAISFSCFVFSLAAGTARGGRVVAGEKKFPNTITTQLFSVALLDYSTYKYLVAKFSEDVLQHELLTLSSHCLHHPTCGQPLLHSFCPRQSLSVYKACYKSVKLFVCRWEIGAVIKTKMVNKYAY